ncbi:MAG: hypothetical protein ACREF3_18185 [Acetobacteraceae bacterium]
MLAGWRGAMRGAGVVIVGTAAVSALSPASAQMNLPPSIGNFQGITGAPNIGGQAPPEAAGRATRPPPAGLPGAQSTAGTAAPAHQPLPMMDPTQELFDAINRGDVAAARDAVSRGADMNGHNVLDLTPVELSIDLGRNDITFMLLANGAGQGAPASGPSSKSAAKLLAAGTSVPARHAAREPRSKPVRLVTVPTAPQAPRLFAGNGGAPIPGAGFLGFDNR